jgi:glycosyltransferase involved in cell wall biosynthesis
MKVLMIARATLYSHPGGDTVQITKTAEYLNKIKGVEVDVNMVGERIDFKKYDFLHLFNITRPSDILSTIKESNLLYVLSTIYINFSEAEANHYARHRRFFGKLFDKDQIGYIKILARILKGQEKLTDYKYILYGQRKSVKKVIMGAKLLLPNSISEYKRLQNNYSIKQKYIVIPNAIDIDIFNKEIESDKYDDFTDTVICVGQITPVKNQLNIIRGLNHSKYKVYIIGNPSSNANAYYNKCKNIAADNIFFIPFLDQRVLANIYKKAKVHVLASWFETTGLVSLEAAFSGCNIVITDRGDQKEYFKNDAYYCEPNDPKSILSAVNKAFEDNKNSSLKERIYSNFTWKITANKTFEAYKEIFPYLR